MSRSFCPRLVASSLRPSVSGCRSARLPSTPLSPFLSPSTAARTRCSSTASTVLQANRLKRVLLEGKRPALGAWQMLPGANVSRALARSGVDWVMVDCEHGTLDDAAMHEAVPAIAALGVSPIVRIPDFQPWMVKRALDSGAHGILAPLVRTVEEVKGLVASAKFPPQGSRGFGSPFAMQAFSPVPTGTEYLQQANDGLLIMVQIETREALAAVEAIAPLVDVLFVGPFDLGNNIGHPIVDGKMDAELHDAIARVLDAANKAGTKCGMYSVSPEQARQYCEAGFHMTNVATDYTALQALMADAVAVASGQSEP